MSNVIVRYTTSVLLAFVIVFGLFWVMQYLIETGNKKLDEDELGRMLEFVRVKQDENIDVKKPKPKKPPEPDEPPPEPPPPALDDLSPDADTLNVSAVSVNPSIDLSSGGFGLAPSDGEYLPIVKVQPVYPQRAQSRGIEGYVIVEFTVTKQGTTKDIRIAEAKPPGMFDRAAMQAASKFKYKPRVVDGQAIEVPGVQNVIRFELED